MVLSLVTTSAVQKVSSNTEKVNQDQWSRVQAFIMANADKSTLRITGADANVARLGKDSILFLQIVLVTDPTLAMHILHSPYFDKYSFMYSFLDPVRLPLRSQ